MTETAFRTEPDHDLPESFPTTPPPLTPAAPAPRRTPAEEARTLVESTRVATLATLSDDGVPWGSLVMYGLLSDGAPVLMVSTLAEHGRNLERDDRGSLMVASPEPGKDPLAGARVTLAGRFERPQGEREEEARAAFLEAVSSAKIFSQFGDFSLWVLRVERVRWVGGYGIMGSDDAASYATAEPDPTAPAAAGAVRHLNEDHADALLAMGQALAGYSDATAARCTGIDRYGLDLQLSTPRGPAPARVGYAESISAPDGLRAATVELAKRARASAG